MYGDFSPLGRRIKMSSAPNDPTPGSSAPTACRPLHWERAFAAWRIQHLSMATSTLQIHYNQNLKPLETLLSNVRRAGDFYVNGISEIPMPALEVDGVGLLSFPVPENQAAALIQRAVQAPYGRGSETIAGTGMDGMGETRPGRCDRWGRCGDVASDAWRFGRWSAPRIAGAINGGVPSIKKTSQRLLSSQT